MKSLLLILLTFTTLSLGAAELPKAKLDKIANAIYRVEGGAKAKVPYGILSIKVKNETEARRICINTIRNNYRRWDATGRRGSYIDYLADRYCPISDGYIGNRNWKKNMVKILGAEYIKKL